MADLDAGSLLLRGLDAVEASSASAREVAATVAAQNAELREYVRQDASFHAASMARMESIGEAIGRLAAQVQRGEDREDRREEAQERSRAEARSWVARAASAAWQTPAVQSLIILALAGALGISTGMLHLGVGQ